MNATSPCHSAMAVADCRRGWSCSPSARESTYVAMRPAPATIATAHRSRSSVDAVLRATAAEGNSSGSGLRPDVSVTLTPEAMQRAGIVVASVTSGGGHRPTPAAWHRRTQCV